LIPFAPRIGKRIRIVRGESMPREKGRDLARNAAAPIDRRSEDVEDDGANVYGRITLRTG
jgi:hypothetical protein